MDAEPYIAPPDVEGMRRKRRAVAKGQKACNPCRLRKVKCSYESPCRVCVNREHVELCVYEAPLKRINLEPASGTPVMTPPAEARLTSRDEWDALCNRITQLEQGLQATRQELARSLSGMHSHCLAAKAACVDAELSADLFTTHPLTGENTSLGGNSVPAMAIALSKSDESEMSQNLLDRSILPVFALGNESATYPFVDLWGLPHSSIERIERLCELVPSDSNCLQYFRQYRDTAHVLFPAIINIHHFETELTQFLLMRNAQSTDASVVPVSEQAVYGKNMHWLGLFFACLASGCQCSNVERRERQLTCQVYVCCAYECLRIVNYLSCSDLDDMQNLLLLGNVISNSMNAGVAWTLLGLTIRLAQGLGLHHAPLCTYEGNTNRLHEIWSRIVWQDSLLSISYDRATSTTSMSRGAQSHALGNDTLPYNECMLKLCIIALEIVASRATSTSTHHEVVLIEERRQEILAIQQQESRHLKDVSACTSRANHLEHWNWNMHRSYVISELCRPMITKHQHKDPYIRHLRTICIEALTDTVAAFLNLHSLTTFARTSWAAVHRSLSSALLLGILREPARNETVQKLIKELIAVMSSIEFVDFSEIPAPISRAVAALCRLNVVNGSEPSGSENSCVTSSSSETSPHAQMYAVLWGMPSIV